MKERRKKRTNVSCETSITGEETDAAIFLQGESAIMNLRRRKVAEWSAPMDDATNRDIPLLKRIEQVSDGWIKKYILTYELPDGSSIDYESVSRKGLDEYSQELNHGSSRKPRTDAISIVPRTKNGELVLIKEFRYPLNSWCIAFPAGLLESGEDIIACASRELKEETGYDIVYSSGNPLFKPLPQPGYSSTGMSEESVHVVYALVEKTGDPDPEPSEFIEVLTVAIDDIPRFLEENTIPIGTRCQLILESFAHEVRLKQELSG